MEHDSRTLVRAAGVLGGSLIVAAAVLAGGAWLIVDRAMGRFEGSVEAHGARVEVAGEAMAKSATAAAGAIEAHAGVLRLTGEAIAQPKVTIVGAVPIEGSKDGRAVPVEASLAN